MRKTGIQCFRRFIMMNDSEIRYTMYWTNKMRADIMARACEDYRINRAILYGIEHGKLKYDDEEKIIVKCVNELDEIKTFIKDDDYHVLDLMTAEQLIQKLDDDFEKNKNEYLKEIIRKSKKRKHAK